MKKLKPTIGILIALLSLTTCLADLSADRAPEFKEVYELLRHHLSGTDESALNRAAVEGLLQQLAPKVTLVDEAKSPKDDTQQSAWVKTTVLEEGYAYFRLGQLVNGAGQEFRKAFDRLSREHSLEGVILDLRFANGLKYSAAAAVADPFFAKEQPLLDWGQGLKKSTAKANAIRLPLAILVNAKTAEAAEALAGILREGAAGLVLGSPTAGQASQFKEFTLKTGQRLRIATQPIKLGGGKELPANGLQPDITVSVSLADEAIYLEDPYSLKPRKGELTGDATGGGDADKLASTNTTSHRINEAELVRRHRQGLDLNPDGLNVALAHSEAASRPPVLQDPVLARALDLLKGLALIHIKPHR